jgi:hypothetical protein
MSKFGSTEEFFQAIRNLAADLERNGRREAATELMGGFSCLNGLTDGWGLLMESLERIQTTCSAEFATPEREALAEILAATHAAVYRTCVQPER